MNNLVNLNSQWQNQLRVQADNTRINSPAVFTNKPWCNNRHHMQERLPLLPAVGSHISSRTNELSSDCICMSRRTDRRTPRRDSLQTTCDCAYRWVAHGRCRRLHLWSTPVISGAEWLICMREALSAAPKHTGTVCRRVVWF